MKVRLEVNFFFIETFSIYVNDAAVLMPGTKYIYPCVSFESLSNFNFMDRFEVILKKKTIALREHPKYFIVNSKVKGRTIEISLSEEPFDMKALNNQCVSVLKSYLCLIVYLLIKLHYTLNFCCRYFSPQNWSFQIEVATYT